MVAVDHTALEHRTSREVKGDLPDSLERLARTLERMEEAFGTLTSHFQRMGYRPSENSETSEGCPVPEGYLGSLYEYLDRLERNASYLESLCETAERIG